MDKTNQEKMIELLKHALMAEEKAVPIYNKHLKSAVFWAGLSEDKSAKIKKVLELLAKESTSHKMQVDKILANSCRRD
jgi:rubrerythrin